MTLSHIHEITANHIYLLKLQSAVTSRKSHAVANGKNRHIRIPCLIIKYFVFYNVQSVSLKRTFLEIGSFSLAILKLGYLRDRNAAAHSVDSDIF